MLKLMIVAVSVAVAVAHHNDEPHTATVHLAGQGTDVKGKIIFTEEGDQVRVTGHISGMPAGDYGFHIHEKGDISEGCGSTGGHYNPEGNDHGHPDDENRHVGDLGNVNFNAQGVADVDILDRLLALRGPHNIIGRAVVLHSGPDDYGRGGVPDSKTTGNAGSRVVCGVIGILNDTSVGTSAASASQIMAPTILLLISSLFFK